MPLRVNPNFFMLVYKTFNISITHELEPNGLAWILGHDLLQVQTNVLLASRTVANASR